MRDPLRFLSAAEAAERLGIHKVTFYRRRPQPPPDAIIGSTRGWLPETIDAWDATMSKPGPRPTAPNIHDREANQ
ncbi:XRE family transcriptional regulator [Kocuria sp. HSID16901]|nr:XRE family transcriptional regulator [Kocuria sp. HSID16901]